MIKENLSERLNDSDDKIFKQAFLELQESYLYTKEKMPNTAPCFCYKREIEIYQQRFDRLCTSQPA